MITDKKISVSFEIFPPKGKLDILSFRNMMDGFSKLDPEFISVTYSAGGGGNSHKTIQQKFHCFLPLIHF